LTDNEKEKLNELAQQAQGGSWEDFQCKICSVHRRAFTW
jgi:hypothetical protein